MCRKSCFWYSRLITFQLLETLFHDFQLSPLVKCCGYRLALNALKFDVDPTRLTLSDNAVTWLWNPTLLVYKDTVPSITPDHHLANSPQRQQHQQHQQHTTRKQNDLPSPSLPHRPLPAAPNFHLSPALPLCLDTTRHDPTRHNKQSAHGPAIPTPTHKHAPRKWAHIRVQTCESAPRGSNAKRVKRKDNISAAQPIHPTSHPFRRSQPIPAQPHPAQSSPTSPVVLSLPKFAITEATKSTD